jgi:cytochrome c oxidase assembly protein subunit 15
MSQLSPAIAPIRSARATGADRAVGYWLLACCAMIYVMLTIGGITRLTASGLSIVAWHPIMGAIPPLSAADWQGLFEAYRHSPEYLELNQGMSLADFKQIFWWEYLHRLWGRLIGLVFLLPFLVFLLRGRIGWRLAPRLAILFLLGALQGALGWYMVESGLVDRPAVSQYRLAAHLLAAILIYGYMLWLALDLIFPCTPGALTREWPAARRLLGWAVPLALMVLLVVLSGAFVAGLHAGLIDNSFPLMEGRLIPSGLWALAPLALNFFENPVTAQFDHRLLAVTLVALLLLFWLLARGAALPRRARWALNLLPLMALLQAGLGISTLLLFVPLPLAATHQAGALALFTLALWLCHELRDAARS